MALLEARPSGRTAPSPRAVRLTKLGRIGADGCGDVELLAIYSHMISNGLYLPDYAIGHIIAFQIAEHVAGGDFGAECERIARQGRLTPDAWVRGAVGGPVSAQALLAAAREALALE